VVQILGHQLGRPYPQRRLDDQRIPEIDRMLLGEPANRDDEQRIDA
jgi:hypothetical protein